MTVIQTDKYKSSKQKAIEMIESGKYGLTEDDFWILGAPTKNKDYYLYNGLIISHTGCLKINDNLAAEDKFRSDKAHIYRDEDHIKVMMYKDDERSLLEFGEVSSANCKNAYPYAMVNKRLFDRVVLRLSKLSYSGIYSEAEAEEFKQPDPEYNTVTGEVITDTTGKPNPFETKNLKMTLDEALKHRFENTKSDKFLGKSVLAFLGGFADVKKAADAIKQLAKSGVGKDGEAMLCISNALDEGKLDLSRIIGASV